MDIEKLEKEQKEINIAIAKEKRRVAGECDSCGNFQVLTEVGMCGPCTFGEAETINGNF